MKKRTYRSKKVNKIDWAQLKERVAGKEMVFAVDVAKEEQFALFRDRDDSVSELIKWQHPVQTSLLLDKLKMMDCQIVVALESTSTYSDALRHQFRRLGFEVYQANGKRVHDSKEVYDGVPSLHDAKAATIIAKHYFEGLTSVWEEDTATERALRSLQREFEMHEGQYQRNQNRLEAFLSRHWPEVTYLLALDSVTLETILLKYGSPARIAANAEEAAELMRVTGRHLLSQEKIDLVIASAKTTLGQPCIEAERRYFQALAREMTHSRLERRRAKLALEAVIDEDEELSELGKLIGKVTTAVLLSVHLDPRNYVCARSFQKAMGLNLKEKSSGRYVGQLKLTKRGSSIARKYLYLAALRILQRDPVVREWYKKKSDPKVKMKTVVALMRKLAKAIWHVGRGEAFDGAKLFSVAAEA